EMRSELLQSQTLEPLGLPAINVQAAAVRRGGVARDRAVADRTPSRVDVRGSDAPAVAAALAAGRGVPGNRRVLDREGAVQIVLAHAASVLGVVPRDRASFQVHAAGVQAEET